MSRKSLAESNFPFVFRDSYATYRVASTTQQVVRLTPAAFDALQVETQQTLLAAQCRLNRGQVYLWEKVEPFLQPYIEQVQSRCTTVDGKTYFVLDTQIWNQLPELTRREWLTTFITADNPPACLSAELSEDEWTFMPNPSIRDLAGTFAAVSGPNCFATALAAITPHREAAAEVAQQWLHQGPFFEGLAERGYCLRPGSFDPHANVNDVVLVWVDDNDVAQHACYLIGGQRVLNKNSQTWFAPRQLLDLHTLLDYWKDDPMRIVVYGREMRL